MPQNPYLHPPKHNESSDTQSDMSTDENILSVIEDYLTDEDVFHEDAFALADAFVRFYFGVLHIENEQKMERFELLHLIMIPVTTMFNNPFYVMFQHEFHSFRTQMLNSFITENANSYVDLFVSMISHIIFLANGRNIHKSAEFRIKLDKVWDAKS